VAEALCKIRFFGAEERSQAEQFLLHLICRIDISIEACHKVAWAMSKDVSEDEVGGHVVETLQQLAQRSDLSVEQIIPAIRFIGMRFINSKQRERVRSLLLELMQRSDLSAEQVIQVAEIAQYSRLFPEKIEKLTKSIIQRLLELEQRSDLSSNQVFQVQHFLLVFSVGEEHEQRMKMLQRVSQDQSIDSNFRVLALVAILIAENSQYEEKAWAMQKILELNQKEILWHYKWHVVRQTGDTKDMPFLAMLAKQELQPSWVRNTMYKQLHDLFS